MDYVLNENRKIIVEVHPGKKAPKLKEGRISRYSKALRKLTTARGGKNA